MLVQSLKSAAQRKVFDLEQQLTDALVAADTAKAEADAALAAQIKSKEDTVSVLQQQGVAKEAELRAELDRIAAIADERLQASARAQAECTALSKTLADVQSQRDTHIAALTRQLQDANEALVASSLNDNPVSQAGNTRRISTSHANDIAELKRMLQVRDDAVMALELERDRIVHGFAQQLQRATLKVPPTDATSFPVGV